MRSDGVNLDVQRALLDTKRVVHDAAVTWAELRAAAQLQDENIHIGGVAHMLLGTQAIKLLKERRVLLELLEQLTGSATAGEQTLAALRARALLQESRRATN